MRSRFVAFVLALLAAALLAACDDTADEPIDPEAQPAPGVTVFAQGDFGQIPVHPRSEELTAREEKGDTVAQSFSVRNTTPQEVLMYYERTLEPAWQQTEEITQLGESQAASYRAVWVANNMRLIVSAAEAPALDGNPPGASDDPFVQYSLSLGPLEAEIPEEEGGTSP